MSKIFVIIVTYKGQRWYDRCFNSLRQSTIPIQTIVVDNASNDGTVEYIKENYPEVILIESMDNLGFGKGNNLALHYAIEHDCDYVFLLNQDAWIEPNTIEGLVLESELHPEYGILSPMHMTADKRSLFMMWEYRSNICSSALIPDLYCHELKDIYSTNYVNAAAWLLPRKSLEKVGGFDPIFQQYSEDDDYINRVLFHNLKIGICPAYRIVHDHQKTHNPFMDENKDIEEKQRLILDCIRPQNNLSVNEIFTKMRLRMFKYVIKFEWKKFIRLFRQYQFLSSVKSQLIESKTTNVLEQPSWLV